MEEFKNIEIRCKKNDDFSHMRNVDYSCGCKFTIDVDDVYSVGTIDYFGQDIYEYYVICPICGHINKLDEGLLSEDIKKSANNKSKIEPFLYRKNNLRSELIYLERISPSPSHVLKRVK